MKQLFALILCVAARPALADEAIIEAVSTHANGDTWQLNVTLSHPDSGWEHYANGWRVLDINGTELGLRVLAHPHVHEQPFTRSLSGVMIPSGSKQIQIQARCLTDGWGHARTLVTLP